MGSKPLDELKLDYRAEPRAIGSAPYDGRHVAVNEGRAGECLQLIG